MNCAKPERLTVKDVLLIAGVIIGIYIFAVIVLPVTMLLAAKVAEVTARWMAW